jgi:hypothetical protein
MGDDENVYMSSNRMFISLDPADSKALSYDVYANSSGNTIYDYANITLAATGKTLFSADFGRGEEQDLLRVFDRIIEFFTEARDEYLKAERYLADKRKEK